MTADAPGLHGWCSTANPIRYHYRGNAEGSPLRLTLGCLLGLQLRRVGSGKRMTFAQQEADLSAWMEENAAVTWVEHSQAWELERELIAQLVLPLNLDHNERAQLTAIRKAARERARKGAT